MDAHKLDARFVVLIPQLDGGWSPREIHRLWVIVLLDVVTRAVIGYHLSLRIEVNKEDVIAAIKNALLRWQRQRKHKIGQGQGSAGKRQGSGYLASR